MAGFSEQFSISKDINPGKSGYEAFSSVIEFTPIEISNEGIVKCKIMEILHSYDLWLKEGSVIPIEVYAEEMYNWELGKRYITSIIGGGLVIPTFIEGHLNDLGLRDQTFEPILQIHQADYLSRGKGLLWSQLIRKYKNSLHTATVYMTNNLETMLIFHQGKVLVSSGRIFSQDDYREGHPVCLISTKLANSSGLELGDRVTLSFSETVPYSSNSILYADSLNHINICEEGTFEIIGLYQVTGNLGQGYGLMEDTVFIPQKSINFWPDNYLTRDNLVSFCLTNGKVEAFLEEMEQHDLPGLNFTFYDQGYSKVSGALAGMKETALLLTGICAAAGLGIILLFSLLFVGRQKRNIAIMYSLGTSRGKALAFLLITVLMVSGLAVTIGGIAGYTLSDRVLEEVYARNSEEITLGTAYSEVYGEDNEVNFQAITPEKPIAPLTAAGTVLVVTLIMSGIFAAKVLRAEPMQVLTEKEE